MSLEDEFLERLAPARSNVPERGTARRIYEREVIPARLDLARVAAHYAVLSLFESFDDDARVYCYEVTRRDFTIRRAGRARLAIGSIEVRSTITHEVADFEMAALHLGETELTGGVRRARGGADYDRVRDELTRVMQPGGIPSVIRVLDAQFGETPLSVRSLFRDEQRRILRELIVATLEEAESTFRQLHERYDPIMRLHTRLGIPVPKVLQTAAEFDLNVQIRRLLQSGTPPPNELEAQLREAQDEGVTLDETTRMCFAEAIERASERFREHPDDLDRLESLERLVTIAATARLGLDLRRAQNRYYRMRAALRPANESSPDGVRWVSLFDELGQKLTMAPAAAIPV